MPDTGPPWNIPYVDDADLVRDYPQASEDLADAIAAGLDAAGNPGIGSNVVSVTKTDIFSTTSSSFVDVDDLEVTITPTSDTAKVLVIADVGMASGSGEFQSRILRGASAIYVGDAAGSRTPATAYDGSVYMRRYTSVVVDSPNSASPVTYKYQVRRSVAVASVGVNRSDSDSDTATFPRGASSLTVIEVAP